MTTNNDHWRRKCPELGRFRAARDLITPEACFDMNERIVRDYVVTQDRAGERFDVVATTLIGEFSREQIKRWIRAGELTVNGAPEDASTRLRGDEQVRLDATLVAREDWRSAQYVPFAVVHEDAALLVIDKPPGVVVHPGAGTTDLTLVNGLLARYPELAVVPRAGIVHRLDKDTSGLMLIARTLAVHARLVAKIAAREVGRRYLVLVHGAVAAPFKVDAPIGRDAQVRTRMAVAGGGRPALTLFRPLAAVPGATLLEAQLTTGRTHQIRVHLAHAGYPVIGDPRYGRRGGVPAAAAFDRQALHAWRLTVTHPVSGAALAWHTPPPSDFADLLRELGIPVPEPGR